jgi:hypothetical protein
MNNSESNAELVFLIIAGIAIIVILYWTGAFNNMHPSMPSIKSDQTGMTVAQLITAQFGVSSDQALKIANCESGFNPSVVNTESVDGSYATGVFQILYPSTWKTTSYADGDPKDAATNIKAAYQIFKRDGNWHEWACSKIVGV